MPDIDARRELHTVHRNAAATVDTVFEGEIRPTNLNRRAKKADSAIHDMRREAQATIMSNVEKSAREEVARHNSILVSHGLPPLSDSRSEQLAMKAVRQSRSAFAGATLNQRLSMSEMQAKGRVRQELSFAAIGDKNTQESARARVREYLTDAREGARSLLGGSNFKYNDRMIQSEMARIGQNTSKMFLEETGLLGRWTLSANHKKRDVCDIHAESIGAKADELIKKYDLGIAPEGAYASDEIPEYPHPYCQCSIHPILSDYGMASLTLERALDNMGAGVGRSGDVIISSEGQTFYKKWLQEEAQKVRPYSASRRSSEEIANKLKRIDRVTKEGMDGSVKLSRSKGLASVIQTGAHRGYEELAKNTLGSYLDPDIVEKLGVENAIKILARDLQVAGKSDVVITALEKYIAKDIPIVTKKALATSRKLMDEAEACRKQVLKGTPKRVVQALRTKALVGAKKELGDALGYAEAHERLLRELRSGKIKYVSVKVKPHDVGKLEKSLGIDPADAKLLAKGRQHELFLGEEALKKVDTKRIHSAVEDFSRSLEAVKSGKKNKDGWLPRFIKATFENKKTHKILPLKLTDDQQTGIRFIKENHQALIHYKPGAGKTLTAMGSITELVADGAVKKALVVVPDNLVRQFRDDMAEFTEGINFKALTYQNPAERALVYGSDQTVTIISHSQLVKDAEAIQKGKFDMVVVDEIHKPPKAFFDALHGVKSEYRVGMTGTAIRESVSDLCEPINWLSDKGVGSKVRFDAQFKGITGASSVYQKAVLRDLRDLVKPLVITRESPVKAKLVSTGRNVVLSKEQRVAVNNIDRRALEMKDGGKPKALVDTWRDKQLAKVVNGGDATTNAKMKEVSRIIDKHSDEQIIIFASDKSSIPTLKQGLGTDGVGYYTTEVSKAQRDKLVKEFRSNPSMRVLVLSDAGSTGLNLENSNVAIHWDLPVNSLELEQRSARNWRGTKTDTTFQYLLSTDTAYDARVKQTLEKTKAASDSLKIAETLDDVGIAKTLRKITRSK